MPTFPRSNAGQVVQDYLDIEHRQRILVVDIGGGLVDIDPTGGGTGGGTRAFGGGPPAPRGPAKRFKAGGGTRKSKAKSAGKGTPKKKPKGKQKRSG
jgi:hypothetical protein